MNLEITYRGYAVSFSENADEWNCYALKISGPKLSTVKAKIDKVIAASRKLENPMPVIYVDYHDRIAEVQVMALAQPRKDRHVEREPTEAWCMVPGSETYYNAATGKRESREVVTRQKLRLDQLFIDTPDNRARVTEITRLHAAAAQIADKIKATKGGMTPLGKAFHIDTEPEEEV